MTQDQFDALCKLLRLRDGAARMAIQMVLVERSKIKDAALALGISYRTAHAAVLRAQRGVELAQAATQDCPKKVKPGPQEKKA
jgi:DNA polymerase III epsilon subunit-like protein